MITRRTLFTVCIGIQVILLLWQIFLFVQPSSKCQNYPESVKFENVFKNTKDQYNFNYYNSSELIKNDFETLIDLKNFEFTINQNGCSETGAVPKVLILIHSAPVNWRRRQTLRETWLKNPDFRAKVLFLFGTVASTDLQYKINEESTKFGDIIQGNFVDSYVNMTYKHVMALKWAAYYCPMVNYVLKIDDDSFVHMKNVYEFIAQPEAPKTNLILCMLARNLRVARSYRTKWRVTLADYPDKYYPPYCQGYAILYTADVIRKLYKASRKHKYFWIDDVHVTGTLAKFQGINITEASHVFLTFWQRIFISYGLRDVNSIKFLFTTSDLDESDIQRLWLKVSENYSK